MPYEDRVIDQELLLPEVPKPAPPSVFATRNIRPAPSSGNGNIRLVDGMIEKDADQNVKRVTGSTERDKYEVSVGSVLRRRGIPLDTKSIRLHFETKRPDCMHSAGSDLDSEWYTSSMIWVCSPNGRGEPMFYSHVGKTSAQGQRFHHSSFTNGGSLIAAGEWIVYQGILKKISAISGHYCPPLHTLIRALQYLQPACKSDTRVLVYDPKLYKNRYVPVDQLIQTNGAGLKSHENGS